MQKTATETFEEMAVFFDTPNLRPYVKDIKTALGREQIILKSGARVKFLARTRNGGRLSTLGIDQDIKVKDWNDEQIAAIRTMIANEFKIEGELRSATQLNIKRLMDIGCYRGIRHRLGLPVRGQSTKNNARTRKGRKKTVANKKKATK